MFSAELLTIHSFRITVSQLFLIRHFLNIILYLVSMLILVTKLEAQIKRLVTQKHPFYKIYKISSVLKVSICESPFDLFLLCIALEIYQL